MAPCWAAIRALLDLAAPFGYLMAALWGWNSVVSDLETISADGDLNRFVNASVLLVSIVLVVRLINCLVLLVLDHFLSRLGRGDQVALLRSLEPLISIVLWLAGALVFLQNQGIQMGAINASLAGAGIGIGLALKGPLINFIDYLTIILDEPFQIGDFIKFDAVCGIVMRNGCTEQ